MDRWSKAAKTGKRSRSPGRFCVSVACAASAVLALLPVEAGAFDNDEAKKSFKKCASCHAIGPEAKNRVGPQLNGLENRPYGGLDGYKYSAAFKKAAESGAVWNTETLDQFLLKPKAIVRGTKMAFGGIRDDKERLNLVSWLLHFDANGKELSDKADANDTNITLLGASASALEGDAEYGEYLSGECVTCHKLTGSEEDDGIPPIVGWPSDSFIDALYRYKTDIRENPVMQTVTRRLGDEEMAALAAYFGSLPSE